jgi:GntR family transcriptional regulator
LPVFTRLRTRPIARPGDSVNIILTRESSVPIRAQLALQIEVAVVTGQLEPGKKLPSVRELARRLGLHHNTVAAAYSELTERGLVESRRGSGLYVSSRGRPSTPERAEGIDDLIASFLEIARARGFKAAEIREAVEAWLRLQPPDYVLLVEPAPDIRAILAHEIAAALPCRVMASGLSALEDEAALDGALLVASFYHSATIRERIGPAAPLVTISLNPGVAELERLRQLPVGALLGIVSGSPILLATVSTVIASIRGSDILVRAVPLSDEAAWRRLSRTADAIVCDSLSGEEVARSTGRTVRVVRLVPDDTLRELSRFFPGAKSID